MSHALLKILLLGICAALCGCGGGSGGDPAAASPPLLVASAAVRGPGGGPVRQEAEYTLLDATASIDLNRQALTFTWSLDQRPAGSTRQLLPSEVPHIVQFDPDLPGNYTATLVVSNATTQSAPLQIPFTVVAEAPTFSTPVVSAFVPHSTPCATYPVRAVAVQSAFSHYPYTVEVLVNGVSLGVRQPGETEVLCQGVRYDPTTKAFMFPMTDLRDGTYAVKVVMRAGGETATTFEDSLTFPPSYQATQP